MEKSNMRLKNMMIATVFASLCLFGTLPPAHAQIRIGVQIGSPPAPNYVWLNGYYDQNNQWVPGVWVVPPGPNYTWIAGYYGDDGVWYPAHWEVEPGPDFIWIAGYYGPGNVWFPAHWDRPPFPGASWHSGRWYHPGDHWPHVAHRGEQPIIQYSRMSHAVPMKAQMPKSAAIHKQAPSYRAAHGNNGGARQAPRGQAQRGAQLPPHSQAPRQAAQPQHAAPSRGEAPRGEEHGGGGEREHEPR